MQLQSGKGKRAGKMQLSGHFDNADAFTVQETVARVSRKRNRRVTMEEAMYEAVADWCAREGVILPSRHQATHNPGPA